MNEKLGWVLFILLVIMCIGSPDIFDVLVYKADNYINHDNGVYGCRHALVNDFIGKYK